MIRTLIPALLLLALVFGASAQLIEVSGRARVLEGDLLVIADTHPPVRLWGIDAPEKTQPCFIAGDYWDCFAVAIRTLETMVYEQILECSQRADTDRRRRGKVYVVCKMGEIDVGEELVRAGMAVAFREQSEDYVTAEDAAREAGVGLWRGEFQLPSVWMQENHFGG